LLTASILDHELDVDDSGMALLERHKPLLRFDPQYDYRLLAVESAVENPGNVLRTDDGEVLARVSGAPELSLRRLSAYPPGTAPSGDDSIAFAPDLQGDARRMESTPRFAGRIYGRVVDGSDGRTWLQYWFWLYYNPKNLFGFGKHEGDWEMVQVGLAADGTPELLSYAQHKRGDARKWSSSDVSFATPERLRPVVYLAQGSHASYFKPRTYPLLTGPLVLGIDHPRGDGPVCDFPIEALGRWARWPGHWGSSERAIFGEGKGPPSPAHQGGKWSDPAGWHRRLKVQRFRYVIGLLIWLLGRLTYPRTPEITYAEADGRRVRIGWKLGRWRSGGHLYITVNDGERVVASRIIKNAERDGATTMLLPEGQRADGVIASAFNFVRQRSDLARARIEQIPVPRVADLHAHYPMHLIPPPPRGIRGLLFTDLDDARVRDRLRALLVGLASRFGNYRSFWSGPRVTIGSLRAGEVRVALSVLYSFFDELALGKRYPALPGPDYIGAVLRQADLVERNIAEHHSDDAVVAHGPGELEDAIANEKVALVHVVEGGFHLGATEEEVTEAVSRLAERGIAYVTLAHLVWRHLATDAPAIPFLPDWLYRWLFPQPNEGLSNLGKAAVKAMMRHRVVIDLSHMSERSVGDTLSLLDDVDPTATTPVIATHSGFRFGSQEYMLRTETVGRIADRGGVVGLIMAQHQLCDGLKRGRVRSFERSIEVICDHINRIASVTDNHDHIAIGSDLDGFIKPTMGGIESMADMARLSRELERRYGEEVTRKICFDNAMRVLRAGWGGAGPPATEPGAAGPEALAEVPTPSGRRGAPPQRV
jgi:microsomal dipeptidase-like Zn-dependent dipeptidase